MRGVARGQVALSPLTQNLSFGKNLPRITKNPLEKVHSFD